MEKMGRKKTTVTIGGDATEMLMMEKMGRKKTLETRAFASRLEMKALWGEDCVYARPKFPTMTIPEIIEFLIESAKGHGSLFKYTQIDKMEKMLASKKLFLSRLSEMNDLDEYANVKGADRTYVASFSFGSIESMEMWKMYGGEPTESVRLGFKGASVRRAISSQKFYKVKVVGNEGGIEYPEIDPADIEWVSFHDVMYKYGTALMWNHKVMGTGRCPELKKVWSIKELQTFVKRYGWFVESETRLVVRLKAGTANCERIAMDFEDPIKGMCVLSGPVSSKMLRIRRAFTRNGVDVGADRIADSTYEVDFK